MVDADRAQVQLAAQLVRLVSRQQDDLAGADRHRRSVRHAQQRAAFRHVVIRDDMRRRSQEGAVVLGPHVRADAPRRRELGVQKHPARQPHRANQIQQSVHKN